MSQQIHDTTDLRQTLIEQLGKQCVSLDAGVLDAHARLAVQRRWIDCSGAALSGLSWPRAIG
jgi:hypothetical protein